MEAVSGANDATPLGFLLLGLYQLELVQIHYLGVVYILKL